MDEVWFSSCVENRTLCEKLREINLVMTDIDGSLTNGGLQLIRNNCNEYEYTKTFNTQDGYIIAECNKNKWLEIGILTGKSGELLETYANNLGVPKELQFYGISDKATILQKCIADSGRTPQNVLYFGDDLPDFYARHRVSIFACPDTAPFYIRSSADLVIPENGASGAFRLLVDLVLYIQDNHPVQHVIENLLEI